MRQQVDQLRTRRRRAPTDSPTFLRCKKFLFTAACELDLQQDVMYGEVWKKASDGVFKWLIAEVWLAAEDKGRSPVHFSSSRLDHVEFYSLSQPWASAEAHLSVAGLITERLVSSEADKEQHYRFTQGPITNFTLSRWIWPIMSVGLGRVIGQIYLLSAIGSTNHQFVCWSW